MTKLSNLSHTELLHQADANKITINRIQKVKAISQLNLQVDKDWDNESVNDFISNPFNPYNHKKTFYDVLDEMSSEQYILQIDTHDGQPKQQIKINKAADLNKFWNALAEAIVTKVNTKKIKYYFIDESNVLCYLEGTLWQWCQLFNNWYEYDDNEPKQKFNESNIKHEIFNLDSEDCNIITGHLINNDWDSNITYADASDKENIIIDEAQQNVLDQLNAKNQQIIMDHIAKTAAEESEA